MSKSVLIVNTPTSCAECIARREAEHEPLGDYTYKVHHKCMVKDKYLTTDDVLKARPKWCPLKTVD